VRRRRRLRVEAGEQRSAAGAVPGPGRVVSAASAANRHVPSV